MHDTNRDRKHAPELQMDHALDIDLRDVVRVEKSIRDKSDREQADARKGEEDNAEVCAPCWLGRGDAQWPKDQILL